MEKYDTSDLPVRVSFLQARDPSILSWNRYGTQQIEPRNLVNDFESESTIPTISEDHTVKVYLRIKNGIENDDDIYQIRDDTLTCKVKCSSRNFRDQHTITNFKFTRIFGPDTQQQDLFNQIVKPKILNFINGRNCSLLAYGASGSGKTFTMVGTAAQPGIIPRALEYLFRSIPRLPRRPEVKPLADGTIVRLNQMESVLEEQSIQSILPASHIERSATTKMYKAMAERLSNEPSATVERMPPILCVYVSCAEIYNERIYDLLEQTHVKREERPILKIGGTQDQFYIKGLKFVHVRSGLEAYNVLQCGINNLLYAGTALNVHSSRSHSIFTIRLVTGRDVDNSMVSSFNFCDLAGSERLKKTMNVGDRLKESKNINSSLSVLGRCIRTIRDAQTKNDAGLPPFRDSKLTHLFQRALMGHEDIMLMININPSHNMVDESIHTLKFAAIAKEIEIVEPPPIKLKPNRFSLRLRTVASPEFDDAREIRDLRDQIAELTLEISSLQQQHKEEMELDRTHYKGIYEHIIEIKDNWIQRLQKELEDTKKLQTKQRENDSIIVLSDDEEDSEDTELSRLREENLKLKTNIYDLRTTEYELGQQLKEKDLEIEQLQRKLKEEHLTIEDAKRDFKQIVEENEKLRSDSLGLRKELLELRDELESRNSELENLRVLNLNKNEED